MRRAALVLLCLAVVGYGLFEARRLWEGPRIVILSPTNGSGVASRTVQINGTAQNIAFLTINDAPAYTDETGHFTEVVALPEGYTVLTVAAVDRFGRRASESVSITMLNFCPNHG